MIRSFTLRRRSLLLLIPAVLFAFLLLDASSASSQTLAINCSVTILPKIGAVRVRSLRTVDDNSWMMVISLNDDGTMVVSTAKTYDPNIWAEGTVVSSIRATQVTADSAGYRWLKVTLLDDKGNQFNLPAYIVEKSKTAVYVKLDCQNATAASGGGSAPTAPPPTAVVPNANPPTATPLTVSLVTVTLTPTPPQPAATSAGTLPTVALSQIFYVSCLRNGAGPGINLLPVSITLASNGKTLSIPVGTYVVRTVDDTGAPLPP
ncbi:MAG TPA: hypothetical protein VMT34_10115, partial [Aggregatilineales bacterium]|nr:hypothetical protein [Aggregatilineales bacterium]